MLGYLFGCSRVYVLTHTYTQQQMGEHGEGEHEGAAGPVEDKLHQHRVVLNSRFVTTFLVIFIVHNMYIKINVYEYL